MIPGGFARKGKTCGVDALYQICLHYNLPIQYEELYAAQALSAASDTPQQHLGQSNRELILT